MKWYKTRRSDRSTGLLFGLCDRWGGIPGVYLGTLVNSKLGQGHVRVLIG